MLSPSRNDCTVPGPDTLADELDHRRWADGAAGRCSACRHRRSTSLALDDDQTPGATPPTGSGMEPPEWARYEHRVIRHFDGAEQLSSLRCLAAGGRRRLSHCYNLTSCGGLSRKDAFCTVQTHTMACHALLNLGWRPRTPDRDGPGAYRRQ